MCFQHKSQIPFTFKNFFSFVPGWNSPLVTVKTKKSMTNSSENPLNTMLFYLYLINLHFCAQKSIMITLLNYNVHSCVPAVIMRFVKSEMTESLLFDNGSLGRSIYTLPKENLVCKQPSRTHGESVNRIIIPMLASVIIMYNNQHINIIVYYYTLL